ncbi:MAG: DUF4430 domain-containing protein [Actinomycetes bacterium]
MTSRGHLLGAIALGLSATLIAAGCGLGPGSQTGQVTLVVTSDFGDRSIGKTSAETATESETAMRQLQRARTVKTRYGGRFVQSIDGLGASSSSGHPFDWFFFVNGIESTVGAADVTLRAGDNIWWDHRDWSAATHVPAVVGAWPHPFTGGAEGKRLPTRLVCAPSSGSQCDKVEATLAAVGIVSARGLPGIAGKGSGLRVLVGTWDEIRADPAAAILLGGPGDSGVYVQPSPHAMGFDLLNPSGQRGATYGAGTGLVAATVVGDALPTWLVTGTDNRGLALAVAALNLKSLTRRFAVLLTAGGRVLPAPMSPESR